MCAVRLERDPSLLRNIEVEGPVVRFEGHQTDPRVVVEVLQDVVPANDPGDAIERRLDHRQEPHRLMVRCLPAHHRLPGEPRP